MSDPLIRDEICIVLAEEGPITVETHGEFRRKARIYGSSRDVKSALGSLIRDGIVRRHRPAPEGCSNELQPIIFSLRQPV